VNAIAGTEAIGLAELKSARAMRVPVTTISSRAVGLPRRSLPKTVDVGLGEVGTCQEPLAFTIRHGSQPVHERFESRLSANRLVGSLRVVSLFHEGFEFDEGILAVTGASDPSARVGEWALFRRFLLCDSTHPMP